MFNAEEAKTISRVNKRKIEAKQLERIIKEIEDRILVAIHAGWGYIGINPELSCFYEVVKYFDDLGYEIFSTYLDDKKRTYIVWDKEFWIKELDLVGKMALKENPND